MGTKKRTMRLFGIIPRPVKMTFSDEVFVLTEDTEIIASDELHGVAVYLQNLLSPATGFKLPNSTQTTESLKEKIILKIDPDLESMLGQEGYRLKAVKSELSISGAFPAGVFYGIQTLRQMLPIEIEEETPNQKVKWAVPCVEIEDYPRFKWRGYMFDICRHYFDKEVIKRMLDLMVLFKLNTFHWHLTEDQGWRIEFKKYPKLTEIGSIRDGTQVGLGKDKKDDGIPHKGFFTEADIKEVIAYAKDRFITVIPEVEMPGHSTAALTAYPEFGCTGGPYAVGKMWGVYKEVYCAGKDKVFEFLQDLLDYVMELFPSEIIHIGGDEVPKDRWKECSDCQKRIKDENLADENALQVYFTNRMAKYLESHGRRLMGWNEILDENLTLNAIGHFWTGGVGKIIPHLEKGRDFVVSNSRVMYLDHSHSHSSLKKAYAYEPIPSELNAAYHKHILGIEPPLWTERVPDLGKVDSQTFPRLIAFAESGWTAPGRKNYESFIGRLEAINKRLSALDVNFTPILDANPGFMNKIKKLFGK
jgi:hexosaminidase